MRLDFLSFAGSSSENVYFCQKISPVLKPFFTCANMLFFLNISQMGYL